MRLGLFVGGSLALVVALVGGLSWWIARPEPAPPPTPAAERARHTARSSLQAIAEASHALMPEGFARVYIGMPVEALRRARPRVRRGAAAPGARAEVWDESLENGARVAWLVAPELGVVTQAQFMSRLTEPAELMPHFRALRARYGDPTGFWDCPEREDASPIRRITWRGEAASVMEAILVHASGVSVTLVVAASGDVAAALRRSACRPVTPATLARWPIAGELRGHRVPFTDMR